MPNAVTRFKKTRLAPTPSGFLHLGNVMSFVITAALARENGAKILLRIDDIDQVRANRLFIQDIFDTLSFLEIPWDEGPRNVWEFEESDSALHRIGLYETALRQLAVEGKVFACTCSRKHLLNAGSCTCINRQIPLSAENAAWRLITNNNRELMVKDIGGEIIGSVLPGGMQHFIVKKKDGYPAYQLTSVIDDLFYGVDLVVRGDDLWPSTLAQHQLAFALGKDDFSAVAFYHHPLLTADNGIKFSKSSGATSIKHLRERGKTQADIYTLIAAMNGITEPVNNWRQLGEAILITKGINKPTG